MQQDMRSSAMVDGLLQSIAAAKEIGLPIVLWASMPCTGGSQMQNLNIARFGVTEKLLGHWKDFKVLWTSFQQIADSVHMAGGIIAIEWPVRCRYWQDPRVLRAVKKFALAKSVAAACMFGLRPQRSHLPNEFIGKQWRISTNCAELAAALQVRCDGSHQHVVTVAGETAATSFYPRGFADAVHKAVGLWSQRVPQQEQLR